MAKITRAGRRRHMQIDATFAKTRNRKSKAKERARRDGRMTALVRGGSLPFPPHIMSWLSRKLGKPSSKIVQADLASLAG